jgi:SM-20-related protein
MIDYPLEFPIGDAALDSIAEALTVQGFILMDDFLAPALAHQLSDEVHNLTETAFKPAAIGRENDAQLAPEIRSNTLYWITGQTPPQQHYLAVMEQLRVGLNRRLFMGLFDFECQYSHYAPGDFYATHLDAFKGQSNRVLSTVYYLNPHWSEEDQGELVLYRDEHSPALLTAMPKFNRCVVFLSDTFPHEVRVTHKDRYAVAGWYRINTSIDGQIDPPIEYSV